MKSKMDNNYTKLTKFEVLIEDIDKKIKEELLPWMTHKYRSYNHTMELIYDYNKLNDYGKIIVQKSSCDLVLYNYRDSNFNDLKIKMEASKELVNDCCKNHNHAYRFVFWALMILSVDETNKDEKLSLICDFASMLNVKEHEILDIIKIIKLIYGENFSESDFKSNVIKETFKDVLKRYNINV